MMSPMYHLDRLSNALDFPTVKDLFFGEGKRLSPSMPPLIGMLESAGNEVWDIMFTVYKMSHWTVLHPYMLLTMYSYMLYNLSLKFIFSPALALV